MSNEMKSSLLNLFPRGPIWNPKPDGDFDKFLDGMGGNAQDQYEELSFLRTIRDPYETSLLADLEREYGIVTNTSKTNAERMAAVAEKRFAVQGFGSITDLQTALNNAGFNLVVSENYPLIDPRPYFDESFQTLAGDPLSQAGELDAIAGVFGFGEIVANGIWYDLQEPIFTTLAGEALIQAGETGAIAGDYDFIRYEEFDDYEISGQEKYWRFIFFVAGSFAGFDNLLNDWNMMKTHIGDWLAGAYTTLSKISSKSSSGDRVLNVLSTSNPDQQLAALPVNVQDDDILLRMRMEDRGNAQTKDLTFQYPGVIAGTAVTNNITPWGKTITLNGTNNVVYLGTSILNGKTVFSISAIVKLTSSGSGGVIACRRQPGQIHFQLSISAADDQLKYYDGSVVTATPTALTAGVYYYVGVSINGANSYMWHVNLSTGVVTYSATFNPTVVSYSLNMELGASTAGSLYLGGEMGFPEVYNRALTTTEVVAEKDRLLLQKVAVFSDVREQPIQDGNMDSPHLDHWTEGNSGVLEKIIDGTSFDGMRYLRITKAGATGYCSAYQLIIEKASADAYEFSGRARSRDGVSIPEVYLLASGVDPTGGSAEWTGTTSTSWQPFFISTAITTNRYLWLSMQALLGTGVEFDEIKVKPVPNLTEPYYHQQLTDTQGNFDGVVEYTENKYNQFGKGRLFEDSANDPNIFNTEFPADSLGAVFTLSAWVKFTGSSMILFSAKNASGTRFEYGIDSSGRQYFYDGTSTLTANTALNDGKYHFVSVVANGASSQFYLDGAVDGGVKTFSITNSVTEPIKVGSSSFNVQLLQDGDMEDAGVGFWTVYNGATLSKETISPYEGGQVLRIFRSGSWCGARTTVSLTVGKTYRLTGVVRSDGTSEIKIQDGAVVLFTGTTSTSWQSYDVTYVATNTRVDFLKSSSAGDYIEIDDISVKEIDIGSAFQGLIAIPSIMAKAWSAAEILAQYNADLSVILNGSYAEQELENPIAEKPAEIVSAIDTFQELPNDGDFEYVDTSFWTAGGGGTLTKDTTNPYAGNQCLRITDVGSTAYAYQTTLIIDKIYRITGWARGDGSATPAINQNAGSQMWIGSSSVSWQNFDVTFKCIGTQIRLEKYSSAGNYVEFDNVQITEIDNKVANGGFERWTSDNPDEWTVVGESGSDPMVTHAGGKCRFYSSSAQIYIYQQILDPGKMYKIKLDVVTYSSGTLRVAVNGLTKTVADLTAIGSYEWSVTNDSFGEIYLRLNSGGGYIEIDNVEVYEIQIPPTIVSAKAYTIPRDVNVPAIYGYNPENAAWEEIAFGERGVIETLQGDAPNGITKIRLYNKFSFDSEAEFFNALLEEQTIERGYVEFNKMDELRTIILDKKPLHSWCGLFVEKI